MQNRQDGFDKAGNLVRQTGDYHIVGTAGVYERITVVPDTPIPRANVPARGGIIESNEPVKITDVRATRTP
jgi:hypothetical protein